MKDLELKKAYCAGAKIDYEMVIDTQEGRDYLDNWLKNFKNEKISNKIDTRYKSVD